MFFEPSLGSGSVQWFCTYLGRSQSFCKNKNKTEFCFCIGEFCNYRTQSFCKNKTEPFSKKQVAAVYVCFEYKTEFCFCNGQFCNTVPTHYAKTKLNLSQRIRQRRFMSATFCVCVSAYISICILSLSVILVLVLFVDTNLFWCHA